MISGNYLKRTVNLASRQAFVCNLEFQLLNNYAKHFCSYSLALVNPSLSGKMSVLLPPSEVKGMQKLEKDMFAKNIKIPYLKIKTDTIDKMLKHLKPFMLKMENLKPVRDAPESPDDSAVSKTVLLHPDLITSFTDFKSGVMEFLTTIGVCEGDFGFKEMELGYENWKCDEILQAVLPEECKGYSRIGHIVHLNLREHLFSYRHVIGQVILDKLHGVSCVVNKTDTIDNTYRNFAMEVIAGDGNMLADVHENGCRYQFNFADVFWNPRLSSEHKRLVLKLERESVLYDVFAGVGPFAIPAARTKKCQVLANDLNIHSFNWLENNIKLNKVGNRVKAYNMDGRQFIREVIKADIVSRWDSYRANSEDQSCTWPGLHVTMNLPAIAVEFLDAFRGLLSDHKHLEEQPEFAGPTIHCYIFCKEQNFADASIGMVESVLSTTLDRETTEAFCVRKVAPNKEMIRVSFTLANEVMFTEEGSNKQSAMHREKPDLDDPLAKRACASKNGRD